jgi:hypothetical protein
MTPPRRGASRPSSPVAARSRRLRQRADALLADDPMARMPELDDLITDACATVLQLRRQHRRVERELSALIAAEGDDPRSAARAAELAREGRDLGEELAQVQALIEGLTPYRRAWERRRKP